MLSSDHILYSGILGYCVYQSLNIHTYFTQHSQEANVGIKGIGRLECSEVS